MHWLTCVRLLFRNVSAIDHSHLQGVSFVKEAYGVRKIPLTILNGKNEYFNRYSINYNINVLY